MNKEPKFTRFDYFENGQMKTNYHIDGEPVSENAYYTALEYYSDKNKNVHIKPKQYNEDYENLEDKIHFIGLHPQYIQALEEDYEESECENIGDYNSMCDRCKDIMDIVRIIRDSEDEEEAFENLEYFTNIVEDQAFQNGHVSALRNYGDMFNDLADKIENDEFDEE